MRCSKCGKMLDNNMLVCHVCNASIRQTNNGNRDSISDKPIQLYQNEPIQQPHEYSESGNDEPLPLTHKSEQTHKGKGKWVAGIAAVTVVAVAAITIPLFLTKVSKAMKNRLQL